MPPPGQSQNRVDLASILEDMLGVSIGAACDPVDGEAAEDLMQAAGQTLDRTRRSGRAAMSDLNRMA
jgi:GGDEF domain-containing protein